ncbi:unnamed protein product [Adineta ricciae]|uniref:Histone H4 n=2 Tax=Adineta ricciae TaxID=249248 RepID=A0A813T296_ADIRI|nr:unnamed protein product [Adineta ricciae]
MSGTSFGIRSSYSTTYIVLRRIVLTSIDRSLEHINVSVFQMPVQFSVESIDYLADKFNNCGSLSDESLSYLTRQVTSLISILLQDACKVLRKCRRNSLTAEDFAFALKLHQLEPMYGGYTISNDHRSSFQKLKRDNRNVYYIDDQIIPFNQLIQSQLKVPLDISLRVHWLAVNGKQPDVNENPTVDISVRSISKKRFVKSSHILSTEQQIYFKDLTETCISSNESKRKQALAILSSDHSLQAILSRLILFISEGIRVNLSPQAPADRSIFLNFLIQMSDSLLQNEELNLKAYLHYFFPAILSCLLARRTSRDHWALRDLAGKCSGKIIRKYATAANGLQQRTINVFYRILNSNEEEYTWSTRYGAFVGLCEMNSKVIIQLIFPLVKRLGERIRLISDVESLERLTEVIVKFLTMAYRSVDNKIESNEKKLYEQFGSYFAPLIQQQLILLL